MADITAIAPRAIAYPTGQIIKNESEPAMSPDLLSKSVAENKLCPVPTEINASAEKHAKCTWGLICALLWHWNFLWKENFVEENFAEENWEKLCKKTVRNCVMGDINRKGSFHSNSKPQQPLSTSQRQGRRRQPCPGYFFFLFLGKNALKYFHFVSLFLFYKFLYLV